MKLIKQSFEIIEQSSGLEGMYKQIELIGRVSHKSEDRITEDSSKEFVDKMIKLGHGAVLEHGTVYLFIPLYCDKTDYNIVQRYYNNPYSKAKIRNEHYCFNLNGYYITTNLRVLIENGWMEHLKFICEPTEYHEKRITVKFICDRVTGESFLRHRVFSFMRESTRYCNYSKDKFNNELTYILPSWMDEKQLGQHNPMTIIKEVEEFSECMALNNQEIAEVYFMENLAKAELNYNKLISLGWKAEQARNILPFCIKSPLIMTGFISDWRHFFDLRALGTTGAPHPQAKELAEPLMKEFIARKYINN